MFFDKKNRNLRTMSVKFYIGVNWEGSTNPKTIEKLKEFQNSHLIYKI